MTTPSEYWMRFPMNASADVRCAKLNTDRDQISEHDTEKNDRRSTGRLIRDWHEVPHSLQDGDGEAKLLKAGQLI